uniref:(northern house mosquito) hypothetical protein n=1 Tax=Culex pipiens TaxID=7175 RepID=A0A8D8AK99_CULPI
MSSVRFREVPPTGFRTSGRAMAQPSPRPDISAYQMLERIGSGSYATVYRATLKVSWVYFEGFISYFRFMIFPEHEGDLRDQVRREGVAVKVCGGQYHYGD